MNTAHCLSSTHHTTRLCSTRAGVGPSGRALDLRHAARSAAATLDELARLLLNVCQAVPQVRARSKSSLQARLKTPQPNSGLQGGWNVNSHVAQHTFSALLTTEACDIA